MARPGNSAGKYPDIEVTDIICDRHNVLKSDVYLSGSNFNARILPQVYEADSAYEQMRAYPKKSVLVRYS